MDTTTIAAEEIMTRRLAVTSSDTHVVKAIEQLIAQGVSGLPVIGPSGEFLGRFSEQSATNALDLGTLHHDSRAAAALREIKAGELMDIWSLVLNPHDDVFHSIGELISRKVSGAPVVDNEGHLLGVFSEQSAMHVFIGLCWEQLPSSKVTAWLDRHDDRQITEQTGLDEVLERFQQRPYRRLMVMRGPRLVGQLTRRDALQAALRTSREPLTTSQSVVGEMQMGLRTDVGSWTEADTTSTSISTDVLNLAQQFLRSSARQIAVLDGQKLLGQISRSDLLRAVQRFFPTTIVTEAVRPLYLSSLGKHDASVLT
jgi:predicted transcriptional regulator